MNEIISGLIGGGIVIALTGVIWKLTNSKIDGKANLDVCEERHRGLDATLILIQSDLREIKTGVMEFIGQRRRDSEE